MTLPPDDTPADRDDESSRFNALRRLLRLLAAVQAADPHRHERRSFGGGLVDGEVRIGPLDPIPERGIQQNPELVNPHVDTRETSNGYVIIADLQQSNERDVSVYHDAGAESVVIDAPGYRRSRRPLRVGHEVDRTQLQNGILEISVRRVEEINGGASDE